MITRSEGPTATSLCKAYWTHVRRVERGVARTDGASARAEAVLLMRWTTNRIGAE